MNEAIEAMTRILAVCENAEDEVTEYARPSLTLLQDAAQAPVRAAMDPSVIVQKLAEFGVNCELVGEPMVGPIVTRYALRLAPGIRLSRVRELAEDLAVALASDRVRILAPIPGTSLVGVEVINEQFSVVGFKPVLEQALKSGYELPVAIGVTTSGEPRVLDLAKMPHLLVAGQTGSGKSVGLSALIMSLLYAKSPEECRLVLIDPKRVEMSLYKNAPHVDLVATEPEAAADVFRTLVHEMEERYTRLEKAGVRNITAYNKSQNQKIPYIVVVVDEMADLIMTMREIESDIVRVAQKARAVGIHLVLATQKPVVKVITGLIKSNIPSRLAYQVASKMDSRVILDCNGAEKLIGRGDMLALYPGMSEPERLHGCWVSDAEINTVVASLRR